MNDPDVIAERFKLLNKANPGSYADVYRAFDYRTNAIVALKFLTKTGGTGLDFVSYESKVLSRLSHPNIVTYVTSGVDDQSGRPFLVTEWLDKRLGDVLTEGRYSTFRTYWEEVGQALVSAVEYLHTNDVHHRDISPSNIMLTASGEVRLADFGIAHIASVLYPAESDSLSTVPFCPPLALGKDPVFRDVWGTCAVAVACLSGRIPETYEELTVLRDSLNDGIPPVRIVKQILSLEPGSLRPSIHQVARLIAESMEIQGARLGDIHLQLTANARKGLVTVEGRVDEPSLMRGVLEDLASEVGFSSCAYVHDDASLDDKDFYMYGAKYKYMVSFDYVRSQLAIRSVQGGVPPSLLEQWRFDACKPQLGFHFNQAIDARKAERVMNQLRINISEFEQDKKRLRAAHEQEGLLDLWRRMLRATEDIEREKALSVSYVNRRVDGLKLWLQLRAEPADELVGSIVEVHGEEEERIAVGEVVEVGDHSCVVYVQNGDLNQIPTNGLLRQSVLGSVQSIKKQFAALARLTSDASARPNLKGLLLDPRTAEAPETNTWVIPEMQVSLDEDKLSAITMAVSVPDIMLVKGPPGTGKTNFIAGLIRTILFNEPNSRVLLASQTHVAVDNAIERILREDPEAKVVRIADAENTRVSPSTRHCVARVVGERWAQGACEAGRRHLEQLATSQGLRLDDVEIGLDLRALLQLRTRQQLLRERLKELGETIEESPETSTLEEAGDSLDLDPAEEYATATSDALSELARVRQTLAQCDLEFQEARRRLVEKTDIGEDFATLSTEDLRGWVNELLPQTPVAGGFLSQVELYSEWSAALVSSEEAEQLAIRESRIVAGTCVGLGSVRRLQESDFDYVVVDEASKANATELLVPLVCGRKAVLVGDSQQLPPYTGELEYKHEILDRYNLSKDDLKSTLFSHMENHLPDTHQKSLTSQYRMVAGIGRLISDTFYGSTLQNRRIDPPRYISERFRFPVTWISTANERDNREVYDGSYLNNAERRVIRELLKHVDDSLSDPSIRIAVIAAYSSQARLLQKEVSLLGIKNISVQVSTVDAFQGREADLVLYSVVRSNANDRVGFIRDYRRLNVALSRARDYLVVVGDHRFIEGLTCDLVVPLVLTHMRHHPDECEIALWTKS